MTSQMVELKGKGKSRKKDEGTIDPETNEKAAAEAEEINGEEMGATNTTGRQRRNVTKVRIGAETESASKMNMVMGIETENLGRTLIDMKEEREGEEAQVVIGRGRGAVEEKEKEATLIPTEIGMTMADIMRGKIMIIVTIEGVVMGEMIVEKGSGLFLMTVTGGRKDHMEKMNGQRESTGYIVIT